MNSRINRS